MTVGEQLLKAFTYDAANHVTAVLQIKDGVEKGARYTYDAFGFGNRTSQDTYTRGTATPAPAPDTQAPQDPEQHIRYTLDLTRQYHNLLLTEDSATGKKQTFHWDANVAAMQETGQNSYYLQDDLGSPIRLVNQNGELQDSYGYDEFGQNLYGNQGIVQPFGYTGYQPDRIAETYYAQAREYRPELGRFAAADVLKGFIVAPYTLNGYGYCWNKPVSLVDLNGREPGEWTPGEDTDYVGVYYLNSEDGAYTFGHAALLFVREDGSGTFYSFAASPRETVNIVMGNDVPGYLSRADLLTEEVDVFLEKNLLRVNLLRINLLGIKEVLQL